MENLNEIYPDVLVTWVKESRKVRFSTELLNDQTSFEVEMKTNNDEQSNTPEVYLNAIERDRARQHVRDLMGNRDLFEASANAFEARAKAAELEQEKLLKKNRLYSEINEQSLVRVNELSKKNKILSQEAQRLKGLAGIAEDELEKSKNWTDQKKNSIQPARGPLRDKATNTGPLRRVPRNSTQANRGLQENSAGYADNMMSRSRMRNFINSAIPITIAFAVLFSALIRDVKESDTPENKKKS